MDIDDKALRDAVVRRLSPPDRRAPVDIARRMCPQGDSCYCCPAAAFKGHKNCPKDHPPEDRKCRQPYPARIPPCPERQTLPQEAPTAPAGFRTPHMSCCIDCGRITARRWTDPENRVLPWCAGRFPKPEEI